MSLEPLNKVLSSVEKQDHWKNRRQFKALVKSWPQIVGPMVAAQTRPLGIFKGVLKVATSNAAWAQNLVFERLRILEKLNQTLPLPITDIRFSPGQWHNQTNSPPSEEVQRLWQEHPSWVPIPSNPKAANPPASPTSPQTPVSAFEGWANTVRSRSQILPLCPQCQCPCPFGELERWSVCALCAAKQWS
ncbi:MAG: DUF721 domain-containing protein [Leptolyngbyaceae cyanobacterium bins.59]|nr:DUF721 domain-containing protein [Leptolyngbyaceae cyanobacterium bins.59]